VYYDDALFVAATRNSSPRCQRGQPVAGRRTGIGAIPSRRCAAHSPRRLPTSTRSTAAAPAARPGLFECVQRDCGIYGNCSRPARRHDLRQSLAQLLEARSLEELSALDIAPDVGPGAGVPRTVPAHLGQQPSHIPLCAARTSTCPFDDVTSDAAASSHVVGPTGAADQTIAKLAARKFIQHGSQDLALGQHRWATHRRPRH